MFYQEKVYKEDIIKQETPGVEESAVIVVECTTVKEDIIKQETPGVEESAVIVVECTTVKEEIKEENMDTEDPLSVQGKNQSNTFIFDIYFYNIKHQFSITV